MDGPIHHPTRNDPHGIIIRTGMVSGIGCPGDTRKTGRTLWWDRYRTFQFRTFTIPRHSV